jgi:hypothetical protein
MARKRRVEPAVGSCPPEAWPGAPPAAQRPRLIENAKIFGQEKATGLPPGGGAGRRVRDHMRAPNVAPPGRGVCL